MIRRQSEHDLTMKSSSPPRHLAPAASETLLVPSWKRILYGKNNISRSGYLPKFHEMLRLPRKVAQQLHQILRLPRKMNLYSSRLYSCLQFSTLLYYSLLYTLLCSSLLFSALLFSTLLFSLILKLRNSEVSHPNFL